MAKSQAERNTVGTLPISPAFDTHLDRVQRRAMQRSEAKRLANGRWQMRKLYGEWVIITRSGGAAMTFDTWQNARLWLFKVGTLIEEESKPF
jgi:hypothetical protein